MHSFVSSAAWVIWSAVVAASLAISSPDNPPFETRLSFSADEPDTSFESFQIWTGREEKLKGWIIVLVFEWRVEKVTISIGFSFFFFFSETFRNLDLWYQRVSLVYSKIWKKERLGHTQHACVIWLGHELRFPPVADTGWFNLAPL